MKKILSILTTILIILISSSCIGRSGPSGIDPRFVKSITVLNTSQFEFYEGEFDPSKIMIHIERANETISDTPLTFDMIKTDLSKLVVGKNTIKAEYLYNVENPSEPYAFCITITILKKDDMRFTYTADQFNSYYYVDGYIGTDEIVTLPTTYNQKPVIGISDSAFLKNDTLKVVNIPSTYTYIGSAAFYQCKNLVSVYIPKEVKSIGEYALNGIRTLFFESAEIGTFDNKWYDEKVTHIYTNVDANNLYIEDSYQYLINTDQVILTNYLGSSKEVLIKETFKEKNIEVIGSFAFGFDKTIEKVTMSDTIKVIMDNAFNNCENLLEVNLSKNLLHINASAFCYCTCLENLILPNKLQTIGDGAFNMCTSLTTLVIPESVKTIDYYAFAWCTGLKELYIHDTLEIFGHGAIYSCSKLTVYTEYKEMPSTWHEGFNPSNRPIKYNQEIK